MTLVAATGRLADLYRRTIASDTAIALVIANAIPLVGVAFLGWSLWTILVLYWVENGIVGFWNVLRILTARGSFLADPAALLAASPMGLGPHETQQIADVERALAAARAAGTMPSVPGLAGVGRIGIAAFFLLHYGIFWLVHGMFVFALPSFLGFAGVPVGPDSFGGQVPDPFGGTAVPIVGFGAGGVGQPVGGAVGPLGAISWASVGIGAVGLFLSHGASFVFNYLGRGENLRASPVTLLFAPYGRVVVLHLTLLFGAFAISLLGTPVVALVILVVLKTILDLRLHLRAQQTGATVAPASAVT